MGAEAHEVDFGHSGRKIARTRGKGKRGRVGSRLGSLFSCAGIMAGKLPNPDRYLVLGEAAWKPLWGMPGRWRGNREPLLSTTSTFLFNGGRERLQRNPG
jgi:hypothetical protein